MIKKVENLSSAQLKHIRQVVGEAFVSNELFHNWGTEPDIHIDDYDSCRWQTELVDDFREGQQPGNPDNLAKVIISVSESENPPLHLAIGEDAPAVLDAYCDKIKADNDAWREEASKTSY